MMFFKKQFTFLPKAFAFILLGSFLFSNVLVVQTFARTTKKDVVKMSVLRKHTTDLTELRPRRKTSGKCEL